MFFSQYKDFKDFCNSNNIDENEGIKLVLENIEKISKKIKEEEGVGKNSQCNRRNSISC